MKLVNIIWENGEHTSIAGKHAFRIALNWLDKLGEFEKFSFFESGNMYFLIHKNHRIHWIIEPKKGSKEE